MILDWALDLAFVAVAAAMALCGWRLLLGPETTDRLLALDTLHINATALAILLGIRLENDLLLEAALIIAMLGLVSTVTGARFVSRGDVIE